MKNNRKRWIAAQDFTLESGEKIDDLVIGYHTFGKLNKEKNNVIWVCHALTGDSNVFDWWSDLFGPHKLFNPEDHFIVCANVLGSCYGTSGPLSYDNELDKYFDLFPLVTTRDMARAHDLLRQELEIDNIHLLIGASLGGQQALEWCILKPDLFEQSVFIATNAKHSPYGIAHNESQRLAIEADRTYGRRGENAGKDGLVAARALAMLSYRSYDGYNATQTEENDDKIEQFKAATYQQYQGMKFARRFDAYSYVSLTKSMDTHNVGRHRGSLEKALNKIKAKSLVIAISSDGLFPPVEQHFLANYINNAQFKQIDSKFGHDGFLVEGEQLDFIIRDFLFNDFNKNKITTLKKVAV